MPDMHFEIYPEKMAPRARFELATNRLTVDCSTAELSGNGAEREVPIAKALPICQALICGKCAAENQANLMYLAMQSIVTEVVHARQF